MAHGDIRMGYVLQVGLIAREVGYVASMRLSAISVGNQEGRKGVKWERSKHRGMCAALTSSNLMMWGSSAQSCAHTWLRSWRRWRGDLQAQRLPWASTASKQIGPKSTCPHFCKQSLHKNNLVLCQFSGNYCNYLDFYLFKLLIEA